MEKEKDTLSIFVDRLKKIGIEIELMGNLPWIYLYSVNGNTIKKEDFFQGNHGFTIAWFPIRKDQILKITDISRTFDIIRKYR